MKLITTIIAVTLLTVFFNYAQSQNLISLLANPPITVENPVVLSPSDVRFLTKANVIASIKLGIYGATAIELDDPTYPYEFYAGYRFIENQDPINKTTIFRLASMSKMVGAVTTLQYIEKNLIQLNDKVAKYIPEFEDATVLIKITPTSYPFTYIQTISGSPYITISFPTLTPNQINALRDASVGIQINGSFSGINIEGIFKVIQVSVPARTVTVDLTCKATVTGTLVVNGTLDVLPPLKPQWRNYDYVYIPVSSNPLVPKVRAYYTEEPSDPVTVRHLLTHTAGISYGSPGPSANLVSLQTAIMLKRDPTLVRFSLVPIADMDAVEWAGRMAKIPMLYQPGTNWSYGPQIGVAGAVLLSFERNQCCTPDNITLYDIQNKILFKRLNITDAGYFILNNDPARVSKISRLAHAYTNLDTSIFGVPTITTFYTSIVVNGLDASLPGLQGALVDGINPTQEGALNPTHPIYGTVFPKRLELADAGLYMRTDEFQKIVTMLVNNGNYNGQQILKASTVQQMVSNQIGPLFIIHETAPLGNVKWGYGVAVGNQTTSPLPLDKTTAHWAGALGGWWFENRPSNTSFTLNADALSFPLPFPGLLSYQAMVNNIAAATA